MPPGHSLVSTTMLPAASRVPCHHPSSMLTYWYPASFRPRDTSASVCALMTLALMFAAKLFHDALPIGGAATTAAALAAAAAVDVAGTVRATATVVAARRRFTAPTGHSRPTSCRPPSWWPC